MSIKEIISEAIMRNNTKKNFNRKFGILSSQERDNMVEMMENIASDHEVPSDLTMAYFVTGRGLRLFSGIEYRRKNYVCVGRMVQTDQNPSAIMNEILEHQFKVIKEEKKMIVAQPYIGRAVIKCGSTYHIFQVSVIDFDTWKASYIETVEV